MAVTLLPDVGPLITHMDAQAHFEHIISDAK
jgi:hypothetical protein